MLVSVACLVVRRLLSCLVVLARSEVSSDAGLLVVRHENAVLPHFAHADEQLLYTFATQILRDQFVDIETFDVALAEWGEGRPGRHHRLPWQFRHARHAAQHLPGGPEGRRP
jgi:hypothetical protein